MRSIIRDNYTPHAGDYHDRLVFDSAQRLFWLFDCDGVVWDMRRFGPRIVDELGDSELDVLSQKFTTEQLSDIRATIAELEERFGQKLEEVETSLTERIDEIEASTDVKDVVGTHEELDAYPTATLGDNDIIKVLKDETMDDATTYWRWNKTEGEFTLVGELGPFIEGGSLKTINGESLVGEGDIEIKGGGGSEVQINITHYSKWEGKYSAEWENMCTVKSIDQEKYAQFMKEYDLREDANFDFQELWDPETGQPSGYAWQVWAMPDRIVIAPEDMLETTGIDVEVDDPEMGWANFSVRYNVEVEKGETAFNSFVISDLSGLCNGNQNTVFTAKDNQGETISIPRKAMYDINMYAYNNQPLPACPDSLLSYAVNLSSVYLPFKEIGENCLSSAGTESDGVGISASAATKVGGYFAQSAKVRSLSLSSVQEVGNGFMQYSTYNGSYFSSFSSLTKAGNTFFYQTVSQSAAITFKDAFPKLETVGDSAFHLSKCLYSSVSSTTLTSVGNSFLSNATTVGGNPYFDINLQNLEKVGPYAFSYIGVTLPYSFSKLTSIGTGFLNNANLQTQTYLHIENLKTVTGSSSDGIFSRLTGVPGAGISIYINDLGVIRPYNPLKDIDTTDQFWTSSGEKVRFYGNDGIYLMNEIKDRYPGLTKVVWADMIAPEGVAEDRDYYTDTEEFSNYTAAWKLPSGFYKMYLGGYDALRLAKNDTGSVRYGVSLIDRTNTIQVIRRTSSSDIMSTGWSATIIEYGTNVFINNVPSSNGPIRTAFVKDGVVVGEWQSLKPGLATLPAADWPEDTRTGVAIWNLPDGVYQVSLGYRLYYDPNHYYDISTSSTSRGILIVAQNSNASYSEKRYLLSGNPYALNEDGTRVELNEENKGYWRVGMARSTNGTASSLLSSNMVTPLTDPNIRDTSAQLPMSIVSGKELEKKITDLEARIKALENK